MTTTPEQKSASRQRIVRLVFAWLALWLPVSLLFQGHPHFPMGRTLAPFSALVLLVRPEYAHRVPGIDWPSVLTPALLFWFGGALFVLLSSRLMKARQPQ